MTDNKPIEDTYEDDVDFIQTIELELEDGTIEECEVLEIIEIDGKSYVALLPMDGNEYYVYECRKLDEENIEIVTIEDEEEFTKAINTFEEYFNEELDDEDYFDDDEEDEDDDDDEDDEEDDDDEDEDEEE
ncbi:MAG: DUF1292 domain-containing protein [Candidatus Cloacimonetes bacterium]|nr:DUF1292 domain-containing protein [Candidatus Cloacimonadota bacterium]